MRSSTSSSKPLTFVALTLGLILAGVVGIEMLVRGMPSAWCKVELGEYYGCSTFMPTKRIFKGQTSRVLIGDSRLEYMLPYKGFEDYSIPALVPSEIKQILEYLLKTRKVEKAIIGIGGHYLQDKSRTRTWDVITEKNFGRQVFPFPVYALEPALTGGFKNYLRKSLTGGELPKLQGKQLFTDKDYAVMDRERREKQQSHGEQVVKNNAAIKKSWPGGRNIP